MGRAAGPFAWLGCALLAGACGGASGETKTNVEQALKQANIREVTVHVDDDAHVVHLRGTVDTMANRTRANEIASAAVGTSGQVLNELTVAGINAESADDFDHQIRNTLEQTLDNDPVLKERDVNLHVSNGAVTITGEVRSAAEKDKVTQIVRLAPGVKDLANALEVRPEE